MDALAFQDKETLKSLMLSFDLLGIELVVFYYVSFFSSMQCYVTHFLSKINFDSTAEIDYRDLQLNRSFSADVRVMLFSMSSLSRKP